MAKQRERIATGLKISDITSMSMKQFESYTPKQQREIVSRLGSAVNKRFSKLESKGLVTPASIRLVQGGGKISVKGKSGEELKRELFRAKRYLQSETSSVSGYKRIEKQIQAESQRTGIPTTEKDVSMGLAFSYYDILTETDSNIAAIKDKYKVVEFIADKIESGEKYDSVLSKTMEYLKESYLEEQKNYNKSGVQFGDIIENDTPKRYRRRRK